MSNQIGSFPFRLCVTTKKNLTTMKGVTTGQSDARQIVPYVPLCFAGGTITLNLDWYGHTCSSVLHVLPRSEPEGSVGSASHLNCTLVDVHVLARLGAAVA